MEERAPLVSAVLPVFNARPFLDEALASLSAQTFIDFELIAVDDGSTDGSRQRLEQERDGRFRLLFHPTNRGPSAARNTGVAVARGKYIAFLDADDVALPARLQTQVEFLERHSEVGILGSAFETTAGDPPRAEIVRMPADDREIRWYGLLECPMRQSTLMVRAALFQKHGLRYDEARFCYEDYDLIMRALGCTRAANLPEPLVRYRRHAGGLTAQNLERLVLEGDSIAHAAIARALPGFSISPEDVRRLRRHLGFGRSQSRKSLAEAKSATALYVDMQRAFQACHAG
jgi:glycosyltransferase involved in cell wall biosynthesis